MWSVWHTGLSYPVEYYKKLFPSTDFPWCEEGRGGREGGREEGGREEGGEGGREGRDDCYTYYSDGPQYL